MKPDIHHEKGSTRSRHLNSFFGSMLEQEKDTAIALWADNFTCSTPVIAHWLENFEKPICVLPNKLPKHYFNNKIDTRKNTRRLKVLYPSGTETHTRDFSIIAGVLARLFQEHKNGFELTILGQNPQLKYFHKLNHTHIKIVEMLPFEKMLELYAAHDVVITPLEKTIFNNAKPSIKYIEAASQGTPIIASHATEFVSKINNGVNGFLCDSDEDWYQILEKLIADKSILHDVGQAAYHRSIKEDCLDV